VFNIIEQSDIMNKEEEDKQRSYEEDVAEYEEEQYELELEEEDDRN
jgi:hypothetical protein